MRIIKTSQLNYLGKQSVSTVLVTRNTQIQCGQSGQRQSLLTSKVGFVYSFHTINEKRRAYFPIPYISRSSFEANSNSDGQEILRNLCKLRVHCRVHNSPHWSLLQAT